jgi:hypothetical protein
VASASRALPGDHQKSDLCNDDWEDGVVSTTRGSCYAPGGLQSSPFIEMETESERISQSSPVAFGVPLLFWLATVCAFNLQTASRGDSARIFILVNCSDVAASSNKVIITCAVTGAIHTPSMSPYLPVTADEIAEAAIGAAEAGAAIVHLHARTRRRGGPTRGPAPIMAEADGNVLPVEP